MSKCNEAHEQLGELNVVGMLHDCEGAFSRKEDGIQVLAGLASFSQKAGSLFRMIHEQVKRSS